MSRTLAEACSRWCLYRERMVELRLVAPTTWHNQSQIASTIIVGLGAIELEALLKSDVDIWIGERLLTHKPVTVRAELNVLRQILNWCVDEQLLGTRPRLPTVQVPTTESALPSEAAFVWALKAVPDHHRDALELMMQTGLSPHEAERLQVRDFALGLPGSVIPCDAKLQPLRETGGYLGIGQRPDFKVKTPSRRRWIPLNPRAQKLWRTITADKRPLDCALPSACAMQKALARARTADPDAPSDTRRVTPKLMRQWFASQIAGDAPEHVLQRLMGHSPGSKITRKHYVRSADEQMVAAVGGLK